MREISKKVVSVILTLTMIVSLAGCSSKEISEADYEEEVLAAAQEYAKNLESCDITKLARTSSDDVADIKARWEDRLDFRESYRYDAHTAAALSAIAGKIEFTIDAGSVKASSDDEEGSVNVTFTLPNYEPLVEDEGLYRIDDFLDALDRAATVDIDLTLVFEKDDDKWLCCNYQEVFESLYEFTEADYDFTVPYPEYIEGIVWYHDEDGTGNYINTFCIRLILDFTRDCPLDAGDIYYTVEYNDQVIYTGDYNSYEVYITIRDLPDHTDPTGSFLAPGEYTIVFYAPDDTVLTTCTATVTCDEAGIVFEENLYWYYSDDSTTSNTNYTNTEYIYGTLVYSGTSYYCAAYATLEYEGEVIYEEYQTDEIFVSSTDEGMPLDSTGRFFAAGCYTITFYDADGNVIVSDTCMVYAQ